MTSGDELPQSPQRGAEGIKLLERETIFRVSAAKVGELSGQRIHHSRRNRVINARAHLDIAGPAYNDGGPYGYTPKGGTGAAVRTLVQVAQDMASGDLTVSE